MTLKNKTVYGFFWSFTEQLLTRGVSAATTVLLAWFLVPEDFGLISMMAVFLELSRIIVDGGLRQALIRKLVVSQAQYSTAFYANLCMGLLVYSGLYVSAPWIAKFYSQPQLMDLVRVAGLTVFTNALCTVQQAILHRLMNFKALAKVSLPAAAISSLVAISLAYNGAGVWALIIQMLISSALTALIYWCLRSWRPSLIFSWAELRDLLGFSGYLLLSQLLNVPFKHMYVIVIAKYISTATAGLYFFAEKIKDMLLNQVVGTIQIVTYPALAQLQQEPERLKEAFRHVVVVTTFVLFPILIFLAAIAETIFSLLLPVDWLPAVIYFQLMCIAALIYPLHMVNLNILKVKGRTDLVFFVGLLKKALAVCIFIISYRHGVTAILIGQIINSTLVYILNSFYAKKLINYSVKEQVMDVLPCLMLSMLIGLVIRWGEYSLVLSHGNKFILLVTLAAMLYMLGSNLIKLRGYKLTRNLITERLRG